MQSSRPARVVAAGAVRAAPAHGTSFTGALGCALSPARALRVRARRSSKRRAPAGPRSRKARAIATARMFRVPMGSSAVSRVTTTESSVMPHCHSSSLSKTCTARRNSTPTEPCTRDAGRRAGAERVGIAATSGPHRRGRNATASTVPLKEKEAPTEAQTRCRAGAESLQRTKWHRGAITDPSSARAPASA